MSAQMRRVTGAIAMILTATAVIEPVALSADNARRLQPWSQRAVEEALQDPSAEVRRAAINWLSRYRAIDASLTPAVAKYLADPNIGIRRAAATTLANMPKLGGVIASTVAHQLETALKDSDRDVRRSAAEALVNMGAAPETVVLLYLCLSATHSSPQEAAAFFFLSYLYRKKQPARSDPNPLARTAGRTNFRPCSVVERTPRSTAAHSART